MNYIDLFAGGKLGVQERFMLRIHRALDEVSFADMAPAVQEVGLDLKGLVAILEGKSSAISHDLIDAVTDPLHLNIQEAFGESARLDADTGLQDEVAKEADAKGFMVVRGASPVTMTRMERIKLFALLEAYQRL